MLYDLIQTRRGKETVMMTDELAKVNDRMKTLRQSQRKQKVEYSVRPSTETKKFYKEPHNITLTPSGRVPLVRKK